MLLRNGKVIDNLDNILAAYEIIVDQCSMTVDQMYNKTCKTSRLETAVKFSQKHLDRNRTQQENIFAESFHENLETS